MKFNQTRGICLLGSVALLLAHSALAQGSGAQPRLVLQALDTDQDGKLSVAEIEAAPRTLLTLDRNGDGQITGDEVQARPQNAGASADELVQQLMSFDRNHDGVLTPDELPARMQNIFQRGDANHDRRLSPEEIRAMAEHQGMPAGSAAPRPAGMMRMDPILSALDTDHDGVLSASEIAASCKSLLVLDTNGDGEITPNEMRMRQQTPAERVDHLFDEWDTNKDGRISRAEAPDRMQQQFESIDKNADGFLERDELLQYFNTAGGGPRGGSQGTNAQPEQTGIPKEQKQ